MSTGQTVRQSGKALARAAIGAALRLADLPPARFIPARWAGWRGLPPRPVARSGTPDIPINVAFIGSPAALHAAFSRAGWTEADPITVGSCLRLAIAALLHLRYPAAPVSRLYLRGRLHDAAVEREGDTIAVRDHVRLWQTGRHRGGGRGDLWLGNVSRDSRVKVLRRQGIPIGTTHRIDPDLDAARARVVTHLRAAGVVAAVRMKPGDGPTVAGRDASGDRFYTDGRVALITLREPASAGGGHAPRRLGGHSGVPRAG